MNPECSVFQNRRIIGRDRLPGLGIHLAHERLRQAVLRVEHVVCLSLSVLVDELQGVRVLRFRILDLLRQAVLDALIKVHYIQGRDELIEFRTGLHHDGLLADEDVTGLHYRVATEIVPCFKRDIIGASSCIGMRRALFGGVRAITKVPVPFLGRCIRGISERYRQRNATRRGCGGEVGELSGVDIKGHIGIIRAMIHGISRLDRDIPGSGCILFHNIPVVFL